MQTHEPRRMEGFDFHRLTEARTYYPSPRSWEDEVLYFLLVDRFSDGKERHYVNNQDRLEDAGVTPPYDEKTPRPKISAAARRAEGAKWQGGTLRGATSKLGYLRRLGITAVWISPVFQQVAGVNSYTGYAIQNFMQVDPHFGTNEDLKNFVRSAHDNGIRVVLDIVINHAGDIFEYDHPGARYNNGQAYPIKGLRSSINGRFWPFDRITPAIRDQEWPVGLIWPEELQCEEALSRQGAINDPSGWDTYPETLDGDFMDLKNLHEGDGDGASFIPSRALAVLGLAYKYWMLYADLDGYRLDTVKHVRPGAVRYLTAFLHEAAKAIRKDNFLIVGEITGGRQKAFNTLDETGLDAALGIDDIPQRMEEVIRGDSDPEAYFGLFRNSLQLHKDSHLWFNDKVVTMVNDHDMVGRRKDRLCASYKNPGEAERATIVALFTNLMSTGIPCIYYGSEQCFDGASGSYDSSSDYVMREAMFGGTFGSFGSTGAHFFREGGPVFQIVSRMAKLRRALAPLRRGRQYLREVSGDGKNWGYPTGFGNQVRSIIAWSRIFDQMEVLLVMNNDVAQEHSVWVRVDPYLNREGATLVNLLSVDGGGIASSTPPLRAEQNDNRCVRVTLGPGAVAVYAQPKVVQDIETPCSPDVRRKCVAAQLLTR